MAPGAKSFRVVADSEMASAMPSFPHMPMNVFQSAIVIGVPFKYFTWHVVLNAPRQNHSSLRTRSSGVISSSAPVVRSEEHTSELQSHLISYAVFCLRSKEHTSELQSHL